MNTITHDEFLAELKTQGVPRQHLAFKCPVCETVQSMTSLMRAGVPEGEVDKYIGFSCVGRWTNAGSAYKDGVKRPPGTGCDWTLGGLFHAHRLVVTRDGQEHPHFELATPEQAQALMQQHSEVPHA